MIDFWQTFFIITMTHLLGAISPGPDFALVSQHTLRYGRHAGLWCSLGITLGFSIHITYSILGLATVLANSPSILFMVKILAACYLLYLGISGLRTPKAAPVDSATPMSKSTCSIKKSISMGFACNVLNPKAPMYFIALFSVFISPELPWYQLTIYGVWMMLVLWLWFALVTVLLSLPHFEKTFQTAGHWINRGFGVVMILLAISIINT